MKTISNLLVLFALAVSVAAGGLKAEEEAVSLDEVKKLADSARESFVKADPGLRKFFDESVGYVIFPHIGKGGFVFAGAYGTGLTYEHGRVVGHASITQATVGAQIGGQVYREVVFFETTEALQAFKESRMEFNAQVAAVLAAEGSSKTARYREGVLVFTDPIKGVMAEASVGGQKFRYMPIE